MSETTLGNSAEPNTGMLPVLSPAGGDQSTYVTLPVLDAVSDGAYMAVFADGSYVRGWRPAA
ncbi:hypothetical protein [Arthrobacter phage SWEP2]|uniref:Uncharacterized protein n=2 Tax=Arthrobacter phage SWEP2 TaxID=2945958 RepID=A0AAF0NYJ7_9CAUD|nr:hypothetical protein [Arthrobacter phage SWEP2]